MKPELKPLFDAVARGIERKSRGRLGCMLSEQIQQRDLLAVFDAAFGLLQSGGEKAPEVLSGPGYSSALEGVKNAHLRLDLYRMHMGSLDARVSELEAQPRVTHAGHCELEARVTKIEGIFKRVGVLS